jgi:exosortase
LDEKKKGDFWQGILAFAVFGALWYLLIRHLLVHWTTNPQYSFGWSGPVICAYLLVIRWTNRPAIEPANSRGAKWVFSIAAFAFLPTWLVEQPNPDWRLVSWLLSLEVVVLSLCAIYFMGGSSWLRHFAFSTCLIFAVVPWPGDAEIFIVQGLMRGVTSVTVGVLNLFHIPALRHGNIIEVRGGLLGINEACSGIRSLQATLMVSLFLGELYRATWQRRVLLVLLGLIIAFLSNLGRTLLLCWIAAKDGVESVSRWHDPAGFSVLGICFLVLWALAGLLFGNPLRLRSSHTSTLLSLPRRLLIGLGAWMLASVVGTEVWYRAHEGEGTRQWSFEWPVRKEHFSEVPIPDPLGDERRAASWTDGDGSRWMAFFFRWAAGAPSSRILARLHRPEICLPAAGYRLRMDRGTITINAKELSIPFHALEFDGNGQLVYVFYCLWQDCPGASAQLRIRDHWDYRLVGLESVILGERNLGQQSLEIVIFGYATPAEAEGAFRRQMEDLIRT